MDAVNQPLLDVRDLSVAFRHQGGSSVAVDHVSFDIKRGECVALVGESGSGKSVSALSVLKLLPYPTASHPSGSIHFRGRDLLTAAENEMRAIRGNDISIIFQEPMTSLTPLHTIESQIGEILQLHSGIRGSAARALGVSNAVIMFRHLLPNAMVATMTFLPFIVSSSVMTLTALDFLGFGLPPGSPSLGELLSQAKANVQAPWLGFTGFFAVAIMLSLLIFIGEAARDAFDPRKTFR